MTKSAGNSHFLREMNQSQVLNIIRAKEGVSRIELAESTGLSATAVGSIVRELIRASFIHETGEGISSGGRRPVKLQLKPRSHYGIGVDIDARFVYLTIIDHSGRVAYQNREPIEGRISPGQAVHIITSKVTAALKENGIGNKNVLGLGVSVPGIVDRINRRIVFAPNLRWEDVNLRDSLFDSLDFPVQIENESVCSALSEQWMGSCRSVEDFVHINIDTGIGAGLFLKGSLYRGTSGSAGEVGHIIVDEQGPLCTCGNRGCLETLASLDGMTRQAGVASFDIFLDSVRKGVPDSVEIMERASRSLGRAVSMLVNTLNPRKVVLGKRFPEYADLAMPTIRREVEKQALKWPSLSVEIVAGSFGEESSSVGAAIMPIRQMMQA